MVTQGSGFATALSSTVAAQNASNETFYGKMGTDYASSGNKTNIYGKTIDYAVGDSATTPVFLMAGQLLRVPVNNGTATTVSDYQIVKITNVADNGYYKNVTGDVVKTVADASKYMGVPSSVAVGATATTTDSEETLAPSKCYVMGTVFGQGSGFPETWKDQPW